MKKRWDVLGIGTVTVDDLLYVDHHPHADEKLPLITRQRQGGGLTATALVTAARQGAATAYWGCLGDDELSRFTLQEFENEGVDVSQIQRVSGSRPLHSVIIVGNDSGSRSIIYDTEGFAEPKPDSICVEVLANTHVLFIDHYAYYSGMQAADIARSMGIPVVADIETSVLPDLDEFLKHVDHLIVGIGFAKTVSGEQDVEKMLCSLAGIGRAVTVITAGAEGCWYMEGKGDVMHYPAFRMVTVDTTGCGDVFHGAYAAAIARGDSIEHAVQIATASAGIKATRRGGRAGIPDLACVEDFLTSHRNK